MLAKMFLMFLAYLPSIATDVEDTLVAWHKDPGTAGHVQAVTAGITQLGQIAASAAARSAGNG